MKRCILSVWLLVTVTAVASFSVARAEVPLSEELRQVKEQIKQEVLQELRGTPNPQTSQKETTPPPALSEDARRVKEAIKHELLEELRAETSRTPPPAEPGKDLRTTVRDEVLGKLKEEDTFLGKFMDRFKMELLVEFGGVYDSTKMKDGEKKNRSSFALTTVQLALGAQLVDWINAEVVFLYEDPTFDDETGVNLNAGAITIGNTERFPLYLTAGALYVPFGALYTHLPDDPLLDLPLTLSLGEMREKALLVGLVYHGLHLSSYVFNGDVDEEGDEDHIQSFGFDAHYRHGDPPSGGPVFTVGASYVSNIADSDGVTDGLGMDNIKNRIGGFDGYFHLEYAGFFLLGEYMTALDRFQPEELASTGGKGARPSVWTVEGGYALEWWRTLEIVLHYEGSRDSGALGFPKRRYGIGFNQTLYPGLILSLGYLHDEYHGNDAEGRDKRDTIFSQLALVF